MYFAILGTFTDICREELLLISPKNLEVTQGVAFFDDYSGNLGQLAGVVKWGRVATEESLYTFFDKKSLVGTNDETLAKFIKSSGRVRRRKQVKELRGSDIELKKDDAVELLVIDNKYCVVEGYQDIKHFEVIDFEKPARGMEIGMMPAKLTQMLVNIGLVASNKYQVTNSIFGKQPTTDNGQLTTIYDPFCGFGTTGMVANYLGHNFIGSDINITACKSNIKRRQEKTHLHHEKLFTVFKHDVLESFAHKKNLDHVDVIVTEGRLGPVIANFHQRDLRKEEYLQKLFAVYAGFLKHYSERFIVKKAPLVMTIPVYQIDNSSIELKLIALCQELGLSFRSIEQVYVRKGQNVGRKICVVNFRI